MTVTLVHFIVLSFFIFFLGIIGFCLNRRHIVRILVSLELILLSSNIAFVGFGRFNHMIEGEIFSLFVLGVAAVEVALGLAIIMLFFRKHKSILMTHLERLKG